MHTQTSYTYTYIRTRAYVHIRAHTCFHPYQTSKPHQHCRAHTYVHIYVHTYVHTYVHQHDRMPTYTYICTHICIYIAPTTSNQQTTSAPTYKPYIHTRTYTYKYTHRCTYLLPPTLKRQTTLNWSYAYVHVHIYTYMHIHTSTHIKPTHHISFIFNPGPQRFHEKLRWKSCGGLVEYSPIVTNKHFWHNDVENANAARASYVCIYIDICIYV